jgi:protein-L-isoaspartate O-methyltransferase
MNVAEAVAALDASATRVLNYAQTHNWSSQGTFALFVQDIDDQSVKASQDAELQKAPDRPLMATAGMRPGAYAVLGQLVTTKNRALDIVVKEVKGDQFRCWMSTHVAERTTQAEFVAAATGRVLVAGLGLGLVLGPLLSKETVERVTVVERSPEVMKLMAARVEELGAGRRLKIVCHDINQWRTRAVYDTIYFDIWPNISARNLGNMMRLRRRYAKNLRPGGWMGCWAQAECIQMLKIMRSKMKNAPKVDELIAAMEKLWPTVVPDDVHICNIDEEQV